MAVTIRDVAREAQVSVATVSRALSSPDLVRPATRDRVLNAASQLGYQPNRAARGLITGRTGNLGIVVPDLNNPFFTGVLKGVQARARQSDYAVFVADSDEDRTTEEQLVRAMAKQVDGVIVCSPGIDDTPLHEAAGITSLVMLNRRLRGVPAALMNSASGMRQIVDHLVALGHRKLVYLNGPRTSWSNKERRRGLRLAIQQHGVELIELGPFPPRYEGGLQACDLALAAKPTAIMAYNDIMALGVLARLRDRGVSVPDDISLTGFDDLMFAELCSPPLTTVAMPLVPAGTVAVDLLLEGLTSEAAEVRQVDLDTQLIVRATTSPPPA
ncbi:LacI family transcriptional regulator [Kibdelosporangium philippinense]|uniref:LacI family transcriptional regulator n=1 Tax=Kibdelosporangium philippinense TaxID=211113 RepID=A0ABS8Z6C3_9PSEU|nr:LacI family DNA-binding transcriptional regulator [Kibdelosporangium philippinense]MCE7003436.1 LacI family transcriptional regulator [Kibdelosporangium philippinense]